MYPPDSWNNVIDVKYRAIATQPDPLSEIRSSTMSVSSSFGLSIFFSPVYAVVEQRPVLSSTPNKELVSFPRKQR